MKLTGMLIPLPLYTLTPTPTLILVTRAVVVSVLRVPATTKKYWFANSSKPYANISREQMSTAPFDNLIMV